MDGRRRPPCRAEHGSGRLPRHTPVSEEARVVPQCCAAKTRLVSAALAFSSPAGYARRPRRWDARIWPSRSTLVSEILSAGRAAMPRWAARPTPRSVRCGPDRWTYDGGAALRQHRAVSRGAPSESSSGSPICKRLGSGKGHRCTESAYDLKPRQRVRLVERSASRSARRASLPPGRQHSDRCLTRPGSRTISTSDPVARVKSAEDIPVLH